MTRSATCGSSRASYGELPGVVQTVLTGNVRMVGEIGAFGEDDDTRAELVRLALSRAIDVSEPA